MAPVKKILVPVDLSPRSVSVACYADSLAERFGAELVFVHACEGGQPLAPEAARIRECIVAMWEGRRLRFLMKAGPAAEVVLKSAQEEEVDLIVMPTRGVTGLSRLFVRPLTAKVMREAACPVWTGVEDLFTLTGRPVETIVCGLSTGPGAESVLKWAAALARQLDARLTVVHAEKHLEPMPVYPCDGEWRLWLRKMARDRITQLQADAGTDAEVWLEPGRPLEALPPVAECLGADLLVIGKSPRRRVLEDFRTMAYDMVCDAPCPVASV